MNISLKIMCPVRAKRYELMVFKNWHGFPPEVLDGRHRTAARTERVRVVFFFLFYWLALLGRPGPSMRLSVLQDL